jgi:hypothetical protein
MTIDVYELMRKARGGRKEFAKFRDDLLEQGVSDREIVHAMASSQVVIDPLGSPPARPRVKRSPLSPRRMAALI